MDQWHRANDACAILLFWICFEALGIECQMLSIAKYFFEH